MSVNRDSKTNRRKLFQMGLSSLAALPLLRAIDAVAKDKNKGKSCVNEKPDSKAAKSRQIKTDGPNAKRLDYVEHYSEAKDHKKFKKGNKCSNCRFFRTNMSKESDKDWAPCTMLANKYVPGCGWCKQYNKDPSKMKKS